MCVCVCVCVFYNVVLFLSNVVRTFGVFFLYTKTCSVSNYILKITITLTKVVEQTLLLSYYEWRYVVTDCGRKTHMYWYDKHI